MARRVQPDTRATATTAPNDPNSIRVNLTNVLQLEVQFPAQVQLAACCGPADVTARLAGWLSALENSDA
jgi:hypothetical protein